MTEPERSEALGASEDAPSLSESLVRLSALQHDIRALEGAYSARATLLREVLEAGASATMVAKLLGISRKRIYDVTEADPPKNRRKYQRKYDASNP